MKLALSSVFLFAVLGADPTVYFSAKSSVAWDPVTKDTEGNLETIASYKLAFWPKGTDPNMAAPTVTYDVPGNIVSTSLAALMAGVPNGTAVDCRVMAIDSAGNESAWSNVVSATVDKIPPQAPGGCRIVK